MDINQLDIESKLAQGSFGTLYKGTYCGQEVAVKILRDIQDDPQQYEEFSQARPPPFCPAATHRRRACCHAPARLRRRTQPDRAASTAPAGGTVPRRSRRQRTRACRR